jgi:hypothetical protein
MRRAVSGTPVRNPRRSKRRQIWIHLGLYQVASQYQGPSVSNAWVRVYFNPAFASAVRQLK